jgi:hypothetical protein
MQKSIKRRGGGLQTDLCEVALVWKCVNPRNGSSSDGEDEIYTVPPRIMIQAKGIFTASLR